MIIIIVWINFQHKVLIHINTVSKQWIAMIVFQMWMHKWTNIGSVDGQGAMQQNYDGYQASLSNQTIQGNILIYIHSFYNNYKIYSYNYPSHDELILFYVIIDVFNVTIQINLTLSLLHIGVCFYATYVIATFCIIKCCNP